MNMLVRGLGLALHALALAVLPVALLLLPLSATTSTARAEGPDTGTSRLLIAEMRTIKASTGKLAGAVAKPDFAAATTQTQAISGSWPAVRDELARRNDSAAISSFEAAVDSVTAAMEAGDAGASAESVADLRAAFDTVEAALRAIDMDGTRFTTAFVFPLLLVAAVTLVLPGIARRVEVKL